MKNVHFIVEGVLAAAIIALFIIQFKSKSTVDLSNVEEKNTTAHSAEIPVAYINVDSLLMNYNLSKEMNEQLISKQESALNTLNKRGKDLEAQIKTYQEKVQNNAFLSVERARNEEARLGKAQQELQQLQQQLTNEYTKEQMAMNAQLRDSVYSFLKEYNQEKKYQMIFSNTNDNIMYADDVYNITNEIIELLNERYSSQEK